MEGARRKAAAPVQPKRPQLAQQYAEGGVRRKVREAEIDQHTIAYAVTGLAVEQVGCMSMQRKPIDLDAKRDMHVGDVRFLHDVRDIRVSS